MKHGNLIKKLRVSKSMTLRDLAKKSGVCSATIYNCEAGKKSPSIDTLKKIAKGLGCDIKQLIK